MAIIAIDGPGGSGKSTVARALATRLGIDRLDTGAMYRSVALLALRRGTDLHDAAALARIAEQIELDLGELVVVDGEDVTAAIRTPEVDAAVSTVAAQPEVRSELVRRQRAWVAGREAVVVEGRDITSVVFPDADVRVYLTADPKERAARRALERVGSHGPDGRVQPEPEAVGAAHAAITARDAYDSSRADSPLVVADGAVVVDSTNRSVDEVVDEIVGLL